MGTEYPNKEILDTFEEEFGENKYENKRNYVY